MTFRHFAKLITSYHQFGPSLEKLNIFPKKDRQPRIVFRVQRKKYQTAIQKRRCNLAIRVKFRL
jgi:hypothetical protein